MTKNGYKVLLRKYLRGETTPDENLLVNRWYESVGEERLELLDEEEMQRLESRYLNKMNRQLDKQERHVPLWPRLAVAASVALLVSVAIYLFNSSGSTERPDAALITQTGPVEKVVWLPDSSRVVVYANSTLRVKHFAPGKAREVFLEGEAFFEVAHEPSRPFLVRTSDVFTKVLGTSFKVTAYKNKETVTVSVKTGKVAVFAQKNGMTTASSELVVLTPNQQMTYNIEKHKPILALVNEPVPVVAKQAEMRLVRFHDEPITNVFETMEKIYSIDLVYDVELLKKCTVTTSLLEGNYYDKLDVLCKAVNATYTVKGFTIIIESKGCN
jgi:transmembrane sensor